MKSWMRENFWFSRTSSTYTLQVQWDILTPDHTPWHTFSRTPLDEWSARPRPLPAQHTTFTTDKHPCPRWDSNSRSQQASGRRPTHQSAQLPRSATRESKKWNLHNGNFHDLLFPLSIYVRGALIKDCNCGAYTAHGKGDKCTQNW